jgi:putative transposase
MRSAVLTTSPEHPTKRRHRERYEIPGHARFLTWSCFHRLPLLQTEATRDIVESALMSARESCRFALYAWVIMPNHVHLLLRPDLPEHPMAEILQQIKLPASKTILAEWRKRDAPVLDKIRCSEGRPRLWQPGGGFDRNIYSKEEFVEKLNYIHLNPVKAGMVKALEEWKWSSAAAFCGKPREGFEPDPLPVL